MDKRKRRAPGLMKPHGRFFTLVVSVWPMAHEVDANGEREAGSSPRAPHSNGGDR